MPSQLTTKGVKFALDAAGSGKIDCSKFQLAMLEVGVPNEPNNTSELHTASLCNRVAGMAELV